MAKQKIARPPIGVWYRAQWGWRPELTAHPLVAYTDKTVTFLESVKWDGSGPFRERREDKEAGYGTAPHKWFATFEEAKARLVKEFQNKLDKATEHLAEVKAFTELSV